ncbi:acetylxylan esterase [Ereboglobus luteus]|uniref:Acetyl xylan esterase domain-containing protein n=1 Tax=Ereboglobus luteus TaxID=1796921 RepID=A0A2U8DZV2_9BACT|nr:acetylxylan esterase [Ereboglobus luteus]AWI08119.1 hypothetical protein CKA38_01565 [Ereboglobus luteus]
MKLRSTITLFCCLCFITTVLNAMEMNLAGKFDPKPSPPHEALLQFWSEGNDDLIFTKAKSGDAITLRCRAGVRAVSLKWTLARNLFEQPFSSGPGVARPENGFVITIPTARLMPGLYDLRVAVDCGAEKPVVGICTFGFDVDKMHITDSRPADFSEFWKRQIRALDNVSLDAKAESVRTFSSAEINAYNAAHASLPPDYDPEGHRFEAVEAGKVSFASVDGVRIHGWLAKPKGGAGPFPAMLVLPGAGFAARPMPLEHARHGFLALDIQVHGQPVDAEKYSELPGYSRDKKYEPAEAFYYRNIYLNVVQALRYLRSRSDVDKSRIVVVGGSQGGRLSIVAAALDGEVAAAVPAIAHFANLPYLDWARDCNAAAPRLDGMSGMINPPLAGTPAARCLAYYDTMNFAPDVRCPVMMNAGLIDAVSPATGVYAIYARLAASEKRIVALPGIAHDWSAEFDRRAWRWLDRVLKISNPETPHNK